MDLLIVGSARCVWNDLEKLGTPEEINKTYDVMCLNDMIMYYPQDIDHCFSCDTQMLPKWWDARRPPYKVMFPKVPRFHTVDNGQSTPIPMEKWNWKGQGTSGLGACHVGIYLGYEKIILAGIPLDNSGHFWEHPEGTTNFQREIANERGIIRGDGRRHWFRAKEFFKGKVKSCSGFTRDLLGGPS